MNIKTHISRFVSFACASVATLAALTSCDGIIYQDEGDCDVTYRLRFRYDMNMKFADAFGHEVKSVRLYVFGDDGSLVWQTEEHGDMLAAEDYSVLLPLSPGDYKVLAWCGLGDGESFYVPAAQSGDLAPTLHCHLNRQTDPVEGSISENDLNGLYHGAIDVSLPENLDGGEYVYTMPLTKDTNVFRIVLQHLSGENIEADDFTYTITDNNGWLNHDNSLRDDETISYHAWSKYSGIAGVDTRNAFSGSEDSDFMRHLAEGASFASETRAITDVKVAVAELTVSRLVDRDWSVSERPMLTIRKADSGETVARIPVIDYALLVKGNYHREMDNQEYLDRQDEYNMTFFLDDNDSWLSTTVIINSWRVVLNPTDLQ